MTLSPMLARSLCQSETVFLLTCSDDQRNLHFIPRNISCMQQLIRRITSTARPYSVAKPGAVSPSIRPKQTPSLVTAGREEGGMRIWLRQCQRGKHAEASSSSCWRMPTGGPVNWSSPGPEAPAGSPGCGCQRRGADWFIGQSVAR